MESGITQSHRQYRRHMPSAHHCSTTGTKAIAGSRQGCGAGIDFRIHFGLAGFRTGLTELQASRDNRRHQENGHEQAIQGKRHRCVHVVSEYHTVLYSSRERSLPRLKLAESGFSWIFTDVQSRGSGSCSSQQQARPANSLLVLPVDSG